MERASAGDSSIAAKTGIVGAVIPNALGDQLNALVQKFKDGKLSADAFNDAVDAFGKAHPDAYKDLTLQLQTAAKNAAGLQDAIAKTNAELRVKQGHGTAADLKLLGLDMADGWKTAGTALDAFHDKLQKLLSLVPTLKKQSGLADALQSAKTDYDALVKAAGTDPGLLQQAKQNYDKVVAYLRAKATNEAAAAFPLTDKAIVERIIYVESKGDPNADPHVAGSHALGLGQFEPATWVALFKQVFPQSPFTLNNDDEAIKALRTNADISKQMLEALVRQNEYLLSKAGINTTPGNVYLAHFLGASGAIKMILANPDELASKIAGANATGRNPSVLGGGKTAGQVVNWASSVMGNFGPTQPLTSTGETELEKVNADLDAQIQKWKDEAKAAQDAAATTKQFGDAAERALFIQQKVSDEAQKFKDAGGLISPAQVATVRAAAGALFDVQHAAEQAKKSVDTVVGLSEQRKTAIEELHTAFSDGSSVEQVDALKQQVSDLTQKIKDLLPLTQGLVASIDDPKMVEQLAKVNQQLATLKIGLTDAKQMNTLIADTAVSGWQNFNTTLGQTHKILVAVRTAFLSFVQDFLTQIESMILKQQVLNALSGTGVGDWLSKLVNSTTGTDGAAGGGAALTAAGTTLSTAGATLETAGTTLAPSGGLLSGAAAALNSAAIALSSAATALSAGGSGGGIGGILGSLFGSGGLQTTGDFSQLISMAPTMHTGGLVGSANARRSVPAQIWAGAQRFHSGGLPGLRPGEVMTILQKNEEVLTRDNPRHIFNNAVGASAPAAAPKVELKVVNAIDAADMLSKALGTTAGARVFINHVKANAGAMKAVIG